MSFPVSFIQQTRTEYWALSRFWGFSDEQQTVRLPFLEPRGGGGQSDVEMKNSSFEDSWEGCLCGVSGASCLSPIRLPQINLGLNKAGESFRTGVSVSSFFKELAHWLQSKTSLAPGMVTATSLLASRLEHRLPKFHLVSKAHRTAPWGGTPAQGSSLEDYVGISSAWSVCPGTFQKHTSAGRHVCAYSRCWKDIKRIFFFFKENREQIFWTFCVLQSNIKFISRDWNSIIHMLKKVNFLLNEINSLSLEVMTIYSYMRIFLDISVCI